MTWRISLVMYGAAVLFSAAGVVTAALLDIHDDIIGSLIGGGTACAGLLIGGLVGTAWQDHHDNQSPADPVRTSSKVDRGQSRSRRVLRTPVLVRRDTTANWEAVNPVLQAGEMALDYTRGVCRVGDGSTPWNELPDFNGAAADPCWPAIAEVRRRQEDEHPERMDAKRGFLYGLWG